MLVAESLDRLAPDQEPEPPLRRLPRQHLQQLLEDRGHPRLRSLRPRRQRVRRKAKRTVVERRWFEWIHGVAVSTAVDFRLVRRLQRVRRRADSLHGRRNFSFIFFSPGKERGRWGGIETSPSIIPDILDPVLQPDPTCSILYTLLILSINNV